jgi:predicted TIM-barrel fold metal-dependent hydrolase
MANPPHPRRIQPLSRGLPAIRIAGVLDLMLDWVPDETIRNRILVQNPNKLYGF